MDRDLTAAVITEVAEDHNRPVHLFAAEFDSGDLFLTDCGHNVDYGGDTYVTSQLLGYSQIQETRSLLINRVTITVSGVDQSIISVLMVDDYLNRPARIRKAFLDTDGSVIGVSLIVDGRMDAPRIITDPDTGTCTIGIQIAPQYSDFGRNPGRRTNNADQDIYFPGDLGFEFVTEIPSKIFWGRLSPTDLNEARIRDIIRRDPYGPNPD